MTDEQNPQNPDAGATVRMVGGRYRLTEMIGYGGMAEVHRAKDTVLGRDVAVKLLRSDLARDPVFQQRFRREAQSSAALNHPSIVAVYDTGEDKRGNLSIPYIVMEYVEGRTLRELLNEQQRLLPSTALKITDGILAALDYSHRAGIIHRDIKPGNVMLTTEGDVKVMDFGIARSISAQTATMTQTSAVIGTAQYLSPEQARGATVDARSDLYSTGCVLFELLVGHPPFIGDSPVAVAYQHVRENASPPSSYDPDIPEDIDAIVMKALAKNPANRYQSANEMRLDIDKALAGERVAAPAVLPSETPTSFVGDPASDYATQTLAAAEDKPRRWMPWAVLGAVVLVLIVGGFFAVKALTGGGGNSVTIPHVRGLTVSAAKDALTKAELRNKVVTVKSAEVAKDLVISSDPTEGQSIKKNDVVTLTVSAGPNAVGVPDLAGLTYTEALAKLETAGLVGQRVESLSNQARDTVLSWAPKGSVSPGSTVKVTVAKGTNKVPNLIGMTQPQAVDAATKAGFQLLPSPDTDTANCTKAVAVGAVCGQDPAPDAETQIGYQITIYFQPQPSPSPSPSPTSGAVPNLLGMSQQDANSAATSAGFKFVVSKDMGGTRCTSQVTPGAVCGQNPTFNSQQNFGQTITVYLQPTPSPTPPPPSPTPTTPSPAPPSEAPDS